MPWLSVRSPLLSSPTFTPGTILSDPSPPYQRKDSSIQLVYFGRLLHLVFHLKNNKNKPKEFRNSPQTPASSLIYGDTLRDALSIPGISAPNPSPLSCLYLPSLLLWPNKPQANLALLGLTFLSCHKQPCFIFLFCSFFYRPSSLLIFPFTPFLSALCLYLSL